MVLAVTSLSNPPMIPASATGSFLVPDEEIIRQKLTLLAIQGHEGARFSEWCDPNRMDLVAIKGVGGLTQFPHDVVRQVHHEVERPLTEGVEPPLNHKRCRHGRPHFQLHTGVTGTILQIVNGERIRGKVVITGKIDHRQRPQGTPKNGRNFPGKAIMAPQVWPMGETLIVNFDQHIFGGNPLAERCPAGKLVGAFQQPFMPAAHAQFSGRAQHAFTAVSGDGLGRDGHSSGQPGSFWCERGLHARANVGRPTHRLVAPISTLHLDEFQAVCVGQFGAGKYFPNNNPLHAPLNFQDIFDFSGAHGQTIGELFRRNIADINEIADPIQGNLHGWLRLLRKYILNTC
ncbi:MAG: hypothetical protein KatS3mg112_0199 [Thermogutta sp.]|nr:MAG: hypothetical protein KatS3mg112_0199 [Thermogutta sp.]